MSLNILIRDDSILEGDEKFNITIGLISNGHIVGTPGVATITIVDTTSKCIIICWLLFSSVHSYRPSVVD